LSKSLVPTLFLNNIVRQATSEFKEFALI
jgi:hypothetical protein